MTDTFKTLDVRPTLRAGGEPFADIMAAVGSLAPGEGLRLLATFQPKPLLAVLGRQGFAHEAREIGGGEWEVLFRRTDANANANANTNPAPGPDTHTGADPDGAADGADARPSVPGTDWPTPVRQMDNRDLDPPEPMERILAALETMEEGAVLEALLCREPMFLLPELAARGHAWRGGFDAAEASTYRISIRVRGGADEGRRP